MDRKYEAIPVDEWKKIGKEQYYGTVNKHGTIQQSYYKEDVKEFYTIGLSMTKSTTPNPDITHVLVPIEEQWISVEKPPSNKEPMFIECFVYFNSGIIRQGRYNTKTQSFLDMDFNVIEPFRISHWMPLPTPPKGDNKL